MNKPLMFVFSIISLLGLLAGLNDADFYGGFDFVSFFQIWVSCSIPLIIQFIYILIFRD